MTSFLRKTRILILSCMAVGVFGSAHVAFATDPATTPSTQTGSANTGVQGTNLVRSGLSAAGARSGLVNVCGDRATNICLSDIIGGLIKAVLQFMGILLLILFIYGGFLWMTSAGDSKQVEKARNMIRDAVIGIILIATSFALADFILGQISNAIQPPSAQTNTTATPGNGS